ncbi:hypothetical protein HPP92_022046 [Vanilla planifolia]|uniref:Calcineurin-like phosphoesterase domain-containing protein n=1 Tax=Vanilla planifolia TaxID=51239 RepID=A0A835UF24_VANPL|nr:hypothetical protein HPP92_022046 [Vanilla planifolia]
MTGEFGTTLTARLLPNLQAMQLWPSSSVLLLLALLACCVEARSALSRRVGTRGGSASRASTPTGARPLRFRKEGNFKILQVADMHYADGRETGCLDVFPDQLVTCSDLNTTAFIFRVIRAENPDLVVFTGDNIFGFDSKDAANSLNAAFAPAVAFKLPWAAVLGKP